MRAGLVTRICVAASFRGITVAPMTDCLDFDIGTTNVPVIWPKLREEARPLFKQLCVMQARLERVD